MLRRTEVPDRNWVNIQWLARLRWAQTAGQAATVLVGQFVLDGILPSTSLLLVIGVGLVSNLGLELYFFGDRRRDGAPARRVFECQVLRETHRQRKLQDVAWAAYDSWFTDDINNAKLAAVSTYFSDVAMFRDLLDNSQGEFEAFYSAVRSLAAARQ